LTYDIPKPIFLLIPRGKIFNSSKTFFYFRDFKHNHFQQPKIEKRKRKKEKKKKANVALGLKPTEKVTIGPKYLPWIRKVKSGFFLLIKTHDWLGVILLDPFEPLFKQSVDHPYELKYRCVTQFAISTNHMYDMGKSSRWTY